jgi:hypothetical protein
MSTIQGLIHQLKTHWGDPRPAIHRGEEGPFPLQCSFSPAPAEMERELGVALPPDVLDFWRYSSSAFLFKDAKYGQWGLEIFDSRESQAETAKQRSTRPKDFIESDFVIGRFLGDSDLLVIRSDSAADDFGTVLVALPIDGRNDWYAAAPTFSRFLEKYAANEGDKFWELEEGGNQNRRRAGMPAASEG